MIDVSAVLVTRGDVNLNPILESLPFNDVVVWDNSQRVDLAVYGRYAAIAKTKHPTIFCQDDDCVLAPESFDALLAAYEPGHVVCNQPQRFRDTGFYDDHSLVGFGALFDRDLPEQAFRRLGIYGERVLTGGGFPQEATDLTLFQRTCDIVFTALTPRILIDAPYADLPWAHAENRMWKTDGHVAERTRMLELVRQVRDGAAA